ncbi:hypothetical protein DFR30_2603 [Thiogranum longum]|uniref:Uncharacterized protein n=1 Tax=Thiogranum longum TaxID=1537524 RepID=A0A4R1HF52_9GAMM|nr:hypothetical protein DFR30_2603 [Thiogranum longum]
MKKNVGGTHFTAKKTRLKSGLFQLSGNRREGSHSAERQPPNPNSE